MKPPISNHPSNDILKALLDSSRPDLSTWSPGEMCALLEHQLSSALASECGYFAELTGQTPEQCSGILAGCGCRTFGDVLLNGVPSAQAVRLVKDFAKASMGTSPGDLPKEVARVLYVMAILRPENTGIESITTLNPATIQREARRCLTFAWLPKTVRVAIREGSERCATRTR